MSEIGEHWSPKTLPFKTAAKQIITNHWLASGGKPLATEIANGIVNGNSMEFLVDTGADIVTFSSVQANQLGIDYSRGKDGYASTASGIAALKTLSLDSLNIEGITLYDVPISVVHGQFPQVPLLGGTFLNQLNMSRIGNRMELSLP